jgi:magnesium chelatase subunit D
LTDDAGPWRDAVAAAAIFAVDPVGVGGVAVRSMPGPVRDRWLALLRQLLGPDMPLRRIPVRVDDDRLLGGLDLSATLGSRRLIAQRGILADADGGAVLLSMAERVGASTAAHLARALDLGAVAIDHAGLRLRESARIGLIALDEGAGPDDGLPAVLSDRLGLIVDLSRLAFRDLADPPTTALDIAGARRLLGSVVADEEVIEAFCATALAFGVSSLRVPLFALRVARAAAALEGLSAISDENAMLAARLVIGQRAAALPETGAAAAPPPGGDLPEPVDEGGAEQAGSEPAEADARGAGETDRSIGETVLAAARAAVPPGLLEELATAGAPRKPRPGADRGRSGALHSSLHRGRPAGVRRGRLGGGARLGLAETLRAAAPWQRLRQGNATATETNGRHIRIRPQDFRLIRYQEPRRNLTIFVVDASGSAALNRLAEAKGAVELLLAECYVRRDQVALLVFRGAGPELILPPTRSLARAKRCVAGFPGGGGTPLAAAIDASAELAAAAQRRGEAPSIVMLTDGRANIARDGTPGRERAETDALDAARRLRLAAVPTLLCDVSRRSQPPARRLAEVMNARYLLLPEAKADTLAAAVRATAGC